MRLKYLTLLSVLTFAGCANVPAEFAAQMNRTSDKYASVTREMTRAELVASLGAPQKEDKSSATWEIRFDALNFESLTVEFGSDDRIAKLTRAYGRGTYGPHWSSQRSYAYEKRSK